MRDNLSWYQASSQLKQRNYRRNIWLLFRDNIGHLRRNLRKAISDKHICHSGVSSCGNN
jgi:hypothetical protein